MVFEMSSRCVEEESEKWGIDPSTIFWWMKVVSYSGPTPLRATPRKSSSVLRMPCVIA